MGAGMAGPAQRKDASILTLTLGDYTIISAHAAYMPVKHLARSDIFPRKEVLRDEERVYFSACCACWHPGV